MENLKIEVEETKTYWERMWRGLLWPFIISTCILLEFPILDAYNHKPLEIPIIILIYYAIWLVVIALICDGAYASHISYIEISENRVHIVGIKRNRKFEITDSIEKLTFKLGSGGRLYPLYIKIAYFGNILRQSDKWSWKKEKAFDRLWNYLEKRNY